MDIYDARKISKYLDQAVDKMKQAEAYMSRHYQDQSVDITLKIMDLEKTIRKEYP
jgi:hypothetical protein